MPRAEAIHHVPHAVDLVQQKLHSAEYIAAQMPMGIAMDFDHLDGDTLVPGSTLSVKASTDALKQQWPDISPALGFFLDRARVGSETILKVKSRDEGLTRFGAYKLTLGQVFFDYDLQAGPNPNTTIATTTLDIPRAYGAQKILDLGATHLLPFLLRDTAPAVALVDSARSMQIA